MSKLKSTLEELFRNKKLSFEEAYNILGHIAHGTYSVEEVSAFLTVFRMRKITVEELSGFRSCLRDKSIAVDLSDFDHVDLCGTGGDGKNTFNISTLASFVVAGAGYYVAKHGNYGVSSVCGSSNVLEYLGYRFTDNQDELRRQLEGCHICILHAPLFHPAMKAVGPIRRSIGVRTFFNMLGPMTNPSKPNKQLVGVYSSQLQRYYKYIYEKESCSYRIVHTLDGYDEISLTGDARVISPDAEYMLMPTDVIARKINASELHGGDSVKRASELFVSILKGEGTEAQNSVVLANAAMALQCYQPETPFANTFEEAKESLFGKKAFQSFKKLINS